MCGHLFPKILLFAASLGGNNISVSVSKEAIYTTLLIYCILLDRQTLLFRFAVIKDTRTGRGSV